MNTEFDSALIGFRFFEKDFRIIDGKQFSSEPENYTEWISNNYNENVILNNENDFLILEEKKARLLVP